MNSVDQKYLDLLKEVLETGTDKKDRTGVGTRAIFGSMLKFDLQKGFPLLTTKKIYFKAVVHELLWFLAGSSNIKYLQDNRITIWDEWADKKGNLGPVYGPMWRNWHSVEWIKPNYFEKQLPLLKTDFSKVEPDKSLNETGLVGNIFPTNNSGNCQVIKEYRQKESNRELGHIVYDVQFLNTNYICKKVRRDKLLSGEIKDKYAPYVCGVACIGKVTNLNSVTHKLLYPTWMEMIRRCYDENHIGYFNYGGRGVFVDNRWLVYANFYEDAQKLENWLLKKDFPKKYSLDKDIKCSNKYSFETCVWASKKEQVYNTRKNKAFYAISPDGEKQIWYGIKYFAKRYGFKDTRIIQCLTKQQDSHNGWKFKNCEFNGKIPRLRIVDQIHSVISSIKNNPDSRRHIVSAWNPGEIKFCKLPPCHVMFEFFVHDGKLSCMFLMRSVDVFLGLPFNIASYALLTHMIAQVCGLEVGELIWSGGDVHIYNNHFNQVKEQLARTPFDRLPTIELNSNIKDIDDFRFDDIILKDYECHPTIKADIAV